MRFTTRMLAFAALLACSACANQASTTTSLNTSESQQFSSIRWDDAVSATQVAVVSNGKLISLR